MSDFLARVAARAVGQAVVARPRQPPLIPEPLAGGGDPLIPMIDHEVAAASSATSPALETAPVTSAATASLARVAGGEPSQVAAGARRRPAAAASRPDPDPAGGRGPGADPDTALEHPYVVPARGAIRPAVRVPASPAPPVEVPRFAPPAAAAVREEPQPVRVHIGRLEVRASLQQPVPPQPRRDDPRPPGRSLADYLRGRGQG